MSNWLYAQALLEADPEGVDPDDSFNVRNYLLSTPGPGDLYTKMLNQLGGRPKRKVDHNTYLLKYPDNAVAVRFYHTDIVVVTEDGTVTVSAPGYHTVTTKERLNTWLGRCGWSIYQQRGLWYWWGHGIKGILFTDGDTITPDGKLSAQANPGGLLGEAKQSPDWTKVRGVYAKFDGYPSEKPTFYSKCPKCGTTHGDYKSVKEAHEKRLCKSCHRNSIDKLKDYIASLNDPKQKDKPVKTTSKLFNEAEELPTDPDDFSAKDEIEDLLLSDWIRESVHLLQNELRADEVEIEDEDTLDPDVDDTFEVEMDRETYKVYKDESQLVTLAEQRVRDDLEEDPSNFNQDWLRHHIDKERLKRDLLMDMDFYGEFEDRYSDYEEKVKCLVNDDLLERKLFYSLSGKLLKENAVRNKLIRKAVDDWVEKQQENFDPVAYLEDIYGRDEWVKEGIRIGGIDYAAAASDAVSTDGWEHFLSPDGMHQLKNGAIAIRS